MRKRICTSLAVLLTTALLVAGCGGAGNNAGAPAGGTSDTSSGSASSTGPVQGGTLKVGLLGAPATMDPHKSTLIADRQLYHAIYESLVTLDEQLNIIPGLAESWEQPDDASILFHLRTGVKFHDGTDFDAEAVKWNVERMKDRDGGSLRYSELSNVESVEVVDSHTVKFNLSQPFTPLFALLTDRAGMMVSPAAVEKLGDDFAYQPVGTGPFELVEWIDGQHIKVKRFADHWDADNVYLDEIVYQPIPDDTVRLTNLRAGSLHVIETVAPKDVTSAKNNPDLVFIEAPGLGYWYIIINSSKPPLDKKEVRQALAYAVNREAIWKSLYFETGSVGHGPISNASWAHNPDFAPYDYNLEKAKALLAGAGLADGFTFELQTSNNPLRVQVAQALSATWREIGVNAEIQQLEGGTVTSNMNKGLHEVTLGGWSGRTDPDDDIYRFFHSKGAQNKRFNWSNPEADRLLDAARVSQNTDERRKLYQEAEEIIVDEAPMIFHYFPALLQAHSPKLKGYVSIPDGMMRFKGVWLEK